MSITALDDQVIEKSQRVMVDLTANYRLSLRNALTAPACALVVAIWVLAAGCGPAPMRNVRNSDPSGKIPAIKDAVAAHDRRVIPQLVKDLDSTDSAVRFYSIEGLRRLTHQDFGYRFFDDDVRRDPAVKRWKEWLAQQPDLKPVVP